MIADIDQARTISDMVLDHTPTDPLVYESNAEYVWRLWDEAVQAQEAAQ